MAEVKPLSSLSGEEINDILTNIAERTADYLKAWENSKDSGKSPKFIYTLKRLKLSDTQRALLCVLPPSRVDGETQDFYRIRKPLVAAIQKYYKQIIPMDQYLASKSAKAKTK